MTLAEFDRKWNDIDRDSLNDEQEKEFIEDCFSMYEESGFVSNYHSMYDDSLIHDGKKFVVTSRCSVEKADCEQHQLPMWNIKFEDGTDFLAFPEEICKIEQKKRNNVENLPYNIVETNKTKTNMNARLLQEFRAMQLAVKGALAMKGRTDVKELLIEGVDSIAIGDNALIDTILLDKDIVNINIFDANSLIPIIYLSDSIIEDIIDTMRAKALDIAGTDVMVNLNGEMDYKQIRW